jgi:hypothetical protein
VATRDLHESSAIISLPLSLCIHRRGILNSDYKGAEGVILKKLFKVFAKRESLLFPQEAIPNRYDVTFQ